MKTLLFVLSILLLLSVSACVHKPDIQQGNVITQEMLQKLTIGMDPRQIMGIAGTPLLVDPFRKDRWDYLYSMKSGESVTLQASHISLYFTDQKLSDIKIHQQPLNADDIRSMETSRKK